MAEPTPAGNTGPAKDASSDATGGTGMAFAGETPAKAMKPAAPTEGLEDNQLLLLDIVIYGFEREIPAVAPGATVRELVDDLDSGLKRRMRDADEKMGDNVAEQMSYADWFAVVDAVRRDPALCTLVLDSYDSDERGAKMASFLDGKGRCYAIFAGTGRGEWEDDCVSAYQRDSEQQLRALAWFDGQVLDRGRSGVVASGHSKGGNKAQYLAVRRGAAVERAVSFDGEGFSREFLEAYPDLIAAHAGKIVAYALDNDFVNGLLNPIALPENRRYLDGRHVREVLANHSPFALFAPREDDDGACGAGACYELDLAPAGPQGDVGKTMVAFTDYMQREPSEDEFRRICSFLGKVLENLVASGRTPQQRSRAFSELYASGDFPLTAGYLVRFFQSIGRQVTMADLVRFAMPKDEERQQDVDVLAARLKERLPDKLARHLGDQDVAADSASAGRAGAGATGDSLAGGPDA